MGFSFNIYFMAINYAAKYNPNQTPITGCTQSGNIAVSTNMSITNLSGFSGGVDDTNGYIIVSDTLNAGLVGRSTKNRGGVVSSTPSVPTYWRSSLNTEASFLTLSNRLPARRYQTPFTTGDESKTWLNSNGYWTSWLSSIVTSGLILNLDAGNTASYPGTGNIWYDLSGSNTNGTLANGPAFSSANGGSIVFDGSNDYCDISTSQMTSNLITITGFIKWVVGTGGMFFGFTTYDVWTQAGNLGYNIGSSDVYGISSATVTSLGLIGNWAHYTFVMTKTGSIPTNNKLYINGNLQTLSQQLGTTGNSPGFGSNLRLCSWNNGGFFGNMQYGNLQVYSRELSQIEIQQNYNGQKSRFGL